MKFKNIEKFQQAFEDYMLDEEYAEFIMNNCHGERCIGNGDQLTLVMEAEYLRDEFENFMVDNTD